MLQKIVDDETVFDDRNISLVLKKAAKYFLVKCIFKLYILRVPFTYLIFIFRVHSENPGNGDEICKELKLK